MKTILGILIALILLAFGAGYLAYLNSASILAHMISSKTMTPVTINNIDFGKETFTIHDLIIGNPREARLPTAFKVQKMEVDAPYKHYFKDPIVIKRIEMNNIYVNIQLYTKDQKKGNWQTIMKNLDTDTSSAFSVEREAVIKKLILTNIQIDLILSDGRLHHLSPIPRLEFDNVTSDKGIPTQEITEIIMQQMMQKILLEKGLQSIMEAPANVLRGAIPFL